MADKIGPHHIQALIATNIIPHMILSTPTQPTPKTNVIRPDGNHVPIILKVVKKPSTPL